MWIAPIDPDGALYIAMHMREWDRREIFATRWTDDPVSLAEDTLAAAGRPGALAWMVGLERPIAVIGMTPLWPGVLGAWCYGTDEFRLLGKRLTKLVVRRMIPALRRMGYHRAECRSIEGHSDAHRWLEYLGFRREGALSECGRGRETFYLYGWSLRNDEVSDVLRIAA